MNNNITCASCALQQNTNVNSEQFVSDFIGRRSSAGITSRKSYTTGHEAMKSDLIVWVNAMGHYNIIGNKAMHNTMYVEFTVLGTFTKQ